jgi:acetylornithine aminotransferase
MGGGHFWLHDSIAAVDADIVMMSAGLTGGAAGGVLTLNAALAQQLDSPNPLVHRDGVVDDAALGGDVLPNSWVAAIVAATLDQWIEQSWRHVDVDEFATALAQRLGRRESVRDLLVTGRSIGIELDLPAKLWQEVAADHRLRVSTAGEYAIALQPSLVLGSDEQSELLNRIDSIFDFVEASESQPESEPVSDEETKSQPPVEDDSEYDVHSDESDEFDEEEYEEEEVDDEHEADEELTHQGSATDSADTDPDDAASDIDPETQT